MTLRNSKNYPKSLESKSTYIRITAPENLDVALEGLVRKVLKEQPRADDIYAFAADYFETLLEIRDQAGVKKQTVAEICPFHNDEDAHEMIKLAATFAKPVKDAKVTEDEVKKEAVEKIQEAKTETEKLSEVVQGVEEKKEVIEQAVELEIVENETVEVKDLVTEDKVDKVQREIKTEELIEVEGQIIPIEDVEPSEEIILPTYKPVLPPSTPPLEDGEIEGDPIKELVDQEMEILKSKSESSKESDEKSDEGKEEEGETKEPLEERTEEVKVDEEAKKDDKDAEKSALEEDSKEVAEPETTETEIAESEAVKTEETPPETQIDKSEATIETLNDKSDDREKMDIIRAAVIIQKGYRRFRARKLAEQAQVVSAEAKEEKSETSQEPEQVPGVDEGESVPEVDVKISDETAKAEETAVEEPKLELDTSQLVEETITKENANVEEVAPEMVEVPETAGEKLEKQESKTSEDDQTEIEPKEPSTEIEKHAEEVEKEGEEPQPVVTDEQHPEAEKEEPKDNLVLIEEDKSEKPAESSEDSAAVAEEAPVVEDVKEVEKLSEAEEVKEMEKPVEAEEVKEVEKPVEAEEVKEVEKPIEAEEVKEVEEPVKAENMKDVAAEPEKTEDSKDEAEKTEEIGLEVEIKSTEELSDAGNNTTESSKESGSSEGEVQFISVQVTTVIETQITQIGNETIDESDGPSEEHIYSQERPSLEIELEATIETLNDKGEYESDYHEKMDIIRAAVIIQKGYRRFRARKLAEKQQLGSQSNNITNHNESTNEESTRNTSTRIKSVHMESSKTTDKEGSSAESDSSGSSSATKINRNDLQKKSFTRSTTSRSLMESQSLDSGKPKAPLTKTRSLSTSRQGVTDFEVWSAIEKELEAAATKIQSNFRGYRTRKQLKREDAVQITTSTASASTETLNELTPRLGYSSQHNTGEFHDTIVLSIHPH